MELVAPFNTLDRQTLAMKLASINYNYTAHGIKDVISFLDTNHMLLDTCHSILVLSRSVSNNLQSVSNECLP